jgi:hypothetical protein
MLKTAECATSRAFEHPTLLNLQLSKQFDKVTQAGSEHWAMPGTNSAVVLHTYLLEYIKARTEAAASS